MARLSVVVVGGSLAGLATAVALGRAGVCVDVVERSTQLLQEHGSGLGVDLRLLRQVLGAQAAPGLPVIAEPGRVSANWRDVYGTLRTHAERTRSVTIHDGVTVSAIAATREHVVVDFAEGGSMTADAVIGADGYRSIVRQQVDPAKPDATYAGYLLWRGVLDEGDITSDPDLGRRAVAIALDAGIQVFTQDGRYLVTYPVPGSDGGTGTGQRRLSWNWYWPAPADDHHFFHTARTQRLQRVIGDVGKRQHVGVGDQDPCDVERHVAVADDDRARTREVRGHLLEAGQRGDLLALVQLEEDEAHVAQRGGIGGHGIPP